MKASVSWAFCLFLLPFLSVSIVSAANSTTKTEELNLFTDKKEDPWTISAKFKQQILDFIEKNGCQLGVELGAHVGLTTSLLSKHCAQYWAIEHSIAVLQKNMERNTNALGRKNIAYISMHSVFDDWNEKLPKNRPVDFVLIDAAHDKASVLNDLHKSTDSLVLGAKNLILDDYGAEKGVKEAVQVFLKEFNGGVGRQKNQGKRARLVKFIGEGVISAEEIVSETSDFQKILLSESKEAKSKIYSVICGLDPFSFDLVIKKVTRKELIKRVKELKSRKFYQNLVDFNPLYDLGVCDSYKDTLESDSNAGKATRTIADATVPDYFPVLIEPWTFSDRVVPIPEGVMLEVYDVKTGSRSEGPEEETIPKPEENIQDPSKLFNTTYLVYPAGVFTSGNFQLLGKLKFDASGVGELVFEYNVF